MKYTELGCTGIRVSRICIGCMSFGEPSVDFHLWMLNASETKNMIPYSPLAGGSSCIPDGQRIPNVHRLTIHSAVNVIILRSMICRSLNASIRSPRNTMFPWFRLLFDGCSKRMWMHRSLALQKYRTLMTRSDQSTLNLMMRM